MTNYGMMGYRGIVTSQHPLFYTLAGILYLILLLGLVILVYLGIVKLWQDIRKGGKK